MFFFFFQAEDGIRDADVTGVQTCALPILFSRGSAVAAQQTGEGGVQEVRILVKGGYTPDTVVVQAGKPVRLQFYRDGTADCSERVGFEELRIDLPLPAFQTTAVEFTPSEPGEFRFRCGMNMLKGLLVVEPATADRKPAASPHKFHE